MDTRVQKRTLSSAAEYWAVSINCLSKNVPSPPARNKVTISLSFRRREREKGEKEREGGEIPRQRNKL